MNVILFLATIFNMSFCQTIYEPFDDHELGFLKEGRLHALVSRIDNWNTAKPRKGLFHNYRKYPKIGIRNDYKIGLHYRFVKYIFRLSLNSVYGQTFTVLWVLVYLKPF